MALNGPTDPLASGPNRFRIVHSWTVTRSVIISARAFFGRPKTQVGNVSKNNRKIIPFTVQLLGKTSLVLGVSLGEPIHYFVQATNAPQRGTYAVHIITYIFARVPYWTGDQTKHDRAQFEHRTQRHTNAALSFRKFRLSYTTQSPILVGLPTDSTAEDWKCASGRRQFMSGRFEHMYSMYPAPVWPSTTHTAHRRCDGTVHNWARSPYLCNELLLLNSATTTLKQNARCARLYSKSPTSRNTQNQTTVHYMTHDGCQLCANYYTETTRIKETQAHTRGLKLERAVMSTRTRFPRARIRVSLNVHIKT